MSEDYRHLTGRPDAAEALAWLKEARIPKDRTISGGDGKGWWGNKALAVVQELYDLGAVCVTAVKIEGRVEREKEQTTSTLIVELPEEDAKRAGLFEWQAEFAQKRGWDQTLDNGQDTMLIWLD